MAEDLILIIAIVAALIVGLVAGLLYSSVFGGANKRSRALEDEVDALKREQTEYKQQVNQHFQKTATLFQGLTEQYKTIYTHLAEGSESLCSEHTTPPALDLPDKPRLTETAESPAEETPETKTAKEAEDSAEAPPEKIGAEDSNTKPSEEKKQADQSLEDDNIMGDAPNIPPLSGEDSEKPKVH